MILSHALEACQEQETTTNEWSTHASNQDFLQRITLSERQPQKDDANAQKEENDDIRLLLLLGLSDGSYTSGGTVDDDEEDDSGCVSLLSSFFIIMRTRSKTDRQRSNTSDFDVVDDVADVVDADAAVLPMAAKASAASCRTIEQS